MQSVLPRAIKAMSTFDGAMRNLLTFLPTDNKITKIPMKKPLSDTETKFEISEYIATAFLEHSASVGRNVTVSYKTEALSTAIDTTALKSTHEEADTKSILHARRGANSIHIFSPDTDVLVLPVRRAPDDTMFVTLEQNHREIDVHEIYQQIGANLANALPGLRAISGADVTGSFSGNAKTSFFNKFLVAPSNVLIALTALGKTDCIEDSSFDRIEQFICSVYATGCQNPPSKKLSDLRWLLYCHK